MKIDCFHMNVLSKWLIQHFCSHCFSYWYHLFAYKWFLLTLWLCEDGYSFKEYLAPNRKAYFLDALYNTGGLRTSVLEVKASLYWDNGFQRLKIPGNLLIIIIVYRPFFMLRTGWTYRNPARLMMLGTLTMPWLCLDENYSTVNNKTALSLTCTQVCMIWLYSNRVPLLDFCLLLLSKNGHV